ncbi:MAG: hypothetical protein IJ443_02810 [Firmicutes bacterium]|nr:hypothetical protein [Bacillota bacterium]
MNLLNKRLPACLMVLAVYAATYCIGIYVLGSTGYVAYIVWMTVLLSLLASLGITLIENRIAGLISAVCYPVAVAIGHVLGKIDEATGEYSGWTICLCLFFTASAAAAFYFRMKKVQKQEKERSKMKTRL